MTVKASDEPTTLPSRDDDLWASSLATHLPFLVARARVVVVRTINKALRPLSLNVRTFSLLWLTTEPFAPTQRQLGEFLDLDPSQIVALIDDLEGQGLVQRRANPADRRARQIVATAAGRRLCKKARAAVDEASESAFRGLTGPERDQLETLLRELNRGAQEERQA